MGSGTAHYSCWDLQEREREQTDQKHGKETKQAKETNRPEFYRKEKHKKHIRTYMHTHIHIYTHTHTPYSHSHMEKQTLKSSSSPFIRVIEEADG